MDRDVARRADGEADRREILENVEREVLEQKTRVDVGARGAVRDGVAVRAGARESLRGLRSAGRGLELDHHGLAEARAHFRRHQAQRGVAARARGGGADYEYGLGGVALSPDGAGAQCCGREERETAETHQLFLSPAPGSMLSFKW